MNAWLTALAVLLLSVGSFWMLHRLELEERNATARRLHEPDYYIDKMTRRTLGPLGETANVLRAERGFPRRHRATSVQHGLPTPIFIAQNRIAGSILTHNKLKWHRTCR